MWKLIRSVFSAIWGHLASLGFGSVVGIVFWVTFVLQILPPGTSYPKSLFLSLVSGLAIVFIAAGVRDLPEKLPRKEDSEDRIEK